MLGRKLKKTERFGLIFLAFVFLLSGLAAVISVRPLPIRETFSFITIGLLLLLAGAFGRIPIPRFLTSEVVTPVGQQSEIDQSQAPPDQSLTHVTIEGISHARIRYGKELGMEDESEFCGDCFATVRQYHEIGCDIEECPKCHRQMISCGCSVEELKNKSQNIPGKEQKI